MSYYKFECGCQFKLIDKKICMKLSDIPMNCPEVWKLLGRGETTGVFQLESYLGQKWCKRLKPETVEHIAALGALLRPGCLEAKDARGINMAELYCRRKNMEECVEYVHEALKPILGSTYGVLCYQEQAIQIAQSICGFTPVEADTLRRCVSGDTMFVSKQRGWISIDELLSTGYTDDFLVMDENGKQQWKKIEKIWSTGKHDVRKVESNGGNYVWATKNHQFLTNEGWKCRLRLCMDDYLVTTNDIEFDGEDTISKNLAIVIAGLMTEGYFINDNNCRFTAHEPEMMDYFVSAYTKEFGESPVVSDKYHTAAISVKNKLTIAKYMAYGLSGDKVLPNCMIQMTKETTRQFLSFMLSAEGGITKSTKQFEFSSKSEKFIHQIKLLLTRFNIHSYIHVKNVKDYGIYYRLYINQQSEQLKLLKELVNESWAEYKVNDLKTILSIDRDEQYTTDIVPPNIVKKLLNQYTHATHHSSGRLYNKPISKNKFKKMCQLSKDKYWINFSEGKQYYDQIKSLEQHRKQIETYDFTVEGGDTPYIIANGMVIHNSIGKKIPELMSQCKTLFIEGAKNQGIVPPETAEQIWDGIEKSQRYSFNHSHAVGYGINGYYSAYIKVHRAKHFFVNWINNVREKKDWQEQLQLLAEDLVNYNLKLCPPDIRFKNKECVAKGDNIHFGLIDIKGLGEKQCNKLLESLDWTEMPTWYTFLTLVGSHITASVMDALIKAGALDYTGMNRRQMLFEHSLWEQLSDREKKMVVEDKSLTDFRGALSSLLTKKLDKRRKDKVTSIINMWDNPPFSTKGDMESIINYEAEYIGLPITFTRLDNKNTNAANATCRQFNNSEFGNFVVAAEIRNVREYENPTGSLAFIKLGDETDIINSVAVYKEVYGKCKDIVVKNNTVLVSGYKNKKGYFVVQSIKQL